MSAVLLPYTSPAMRACARKLVAILLALLVVGGPLLSLNAQGMAHELEHLGVSGLESGALSDAEHEIAHAAGPCEPGLALFAQSLAPAGAHWSPHRAAALVPRSADLQSSFRPPRSLPLALA